LEGTCECNPSALIKLEFGELFPLLRIEGCEGPAVPLPDPKTGLAFKNMLGLSRGQHGGACNHTKVENERNFRKAEGLDYERSTFTASFPGNGSPRSFMLEKN
jgi:hypothetical protein